MKLTEYLNDSLSITGYSQVLRQTDYDGEGNIVQTITNIIGHQRISQKTVKNGVESELWFGFDGHGSTRVLMDVAGAIAQLFAYDAYGNAVGFDPAQALTEFLYSGEQFDAKIGQQYLRQRYYDPSTGRFNRLDPFFGNLNDPQSLHKYTYAHNDPVNMTDPTGLFGLGGISISMSLGTGMRSMNISATLAGLNGLMGGFSNGVANLSSNTPGLSNFWKFSLGSLAGFAGSYLATAISPSNAFSSGALSGALTSGFTRVLNCLFDPSLREAIEAEKLPSIILSTFVDALWSGVSAATIYRLCPAVRPGTPAPQVNTVRSITFRYIAGDSWWTMDTTVKNFGSNTMRTLYNEALIDLYGTDLWASFKYCAGTFFPNIDSYLP